MTPEPAVPPGPAGSGASALATSAGPGAWTAAQPESPRQIRHLFTGRRGGVSSPPYDELNLGGAVGDDPAAVAVNRSRLAQVAKLPAAQVVWMHQVHGTRVITVTGGSATTPEVPGHAPPAEVPGHAPTSGVAGRGVRHESDGIVTAAAGLGLAVLVADCVPILAGDPVAGVIAAVHAGRRGAAGGIALRALEQMITTGASPGTTHVLLGPAICGGCYEVPAQLRDEVEAALPGSACTTDRGSPGLDLRAGLARQLRAAGVGSVVIDSRCTYTDPDLFSHRRGAPTGRFAGLVWMPH